MLVITLREWLDRVAGHPRKRRSISRSKRHLEMMNAHEVITQFANLVRTIGDYVSDPARFIELELALTLHTISHEEREELLELRNELVDWNRWMATNPYESLIDLAEVLDESNLGTTERAVVLMDFTCHVMEDLDYQLIAERIDDKIVVTRRPKSGKASDPQPSTKIEYEDLTEKQFSELVEDVRFKKLTSNGDDSRNMRFGSYEKLVTALDRAAFARRMWDQRSSADVDGQTWPMFGPMPWSRTRIERELLAIDPTLADPNVVGVAGGLCAAPLGHLIHYALLHRVISRRQAQFIYHQDSGPGGRKLWNRSID
jgi:hypothetical protein